MFCQLIKISENLIRLVSHMASYFTVCVIFPETSSLCIGNSRPYFYSYFKCVYILPETSSLFISKNINIKGKLERLNVRKCVKMEDR